jgi:MoxR-like ATPase
MNCQRAANYLPLYDRFLLRFMTQYIASPQNFVNMLASQPSLSNTVITLQELTAMQTETEKVALPDEVYIALVNLREVLKKENIIASDRRYKQALSLIKANAYLGGRTKAAPDDLAILQHVLWSQPSEYKMVQKLVLTTVNPVLSKVQELIDLAKEVYHQALDPNAQKDKEAGNKIGFEATVKLRRIQEDLRKIETTPETAKVIDDARAKVKAYTDEVAVGQNSSIPSIQKMKTHRLCSLLDFTSIFNSWNEFFILSTLDSHVNVPCIYCFFRNI